LPRLAVLAVLVFVVALFWVGWFRLGNVLWVWDSTEFQRYAQTLDETGRIPTKADNYEFSLPPAMPALAVGLERAARWIGPTDVRPARALPRQVRATLWAVLVLAAGWLFFTGRPGARRRWAGIVLAAAAVVVAALEVVSAATTFNWVAGLIPQMASVLGLIVIAALLARELWPEERWAPPLAAFGTALLPFVFRIGLVFHPDPLFAVLVCAALLLTVRALRTGWTVRAGAATGLLLALAALTRQSAPVAIVGIALVGLLLGRRNSLRFLVAAAVVLVVCAGPWWGYQAHKYGNPIQSNLSRPGLMLSHEPLSFFVGGGRQLVTHPWNVLKGNFLFSKFHVGIWSNWTGVGSPHGPHDTNLKGLASSQSVLGLAGDALVLGGLGLLGVPALWRTVRRRTVDPTERGLAALSLFFLVAWVAFVATVLRFPQRDADPVQPHYLMFLTPAAVLLGLASARHLWLAGGWRRGVVFGWVALYTVSWTWALIAMV
jgi:4-amino-4-deoxy-L-arabinose transferase-like glycosyltransferase